MSKGQMLRVLVNVRLTAAAEEIFALFERTIAEYEEELCRSKKENQRKQELLESVRMNPRVVLLRAGVQVHSTSPDPSLNQDLDQDLETPETPQIKAEQSVKQEEEQLPVQLLLPAVPESSAVCVKTEESSLIQQRQNEHKEETQGEDISKEPHLHSETEGDLELSSDTDDSEDWRAPFSCSAAQMETESDGDHDIQVQIRDRSTAPQNSGLSPKDQSAPETSDAVNKGDMSGKAEGKKHQCPMCQNRFQTKRILENHIRVHTGEKPYSCLICKKTFSQKWNLDTHVRTHTGEKPYRCLTCKKTFAQKGTLDKHIKTHTGEKPFRCSTCEKTFSRKSFLVVHTRTHTGEKPFRCSTCEKTFSRKSFLVIHTRTHTGEKPYSCSTCKKTFTQKYSLIVHTRTHTGERPYSCSICNRGFIDSSSLRIHMRTHRK